MGDRAPGPLRAEEDEAAFDALVLRVEPGLRRALIAAYGSHVGRDATADALAWAWEHFDRARDLDNPAGYLFRVGQTSARRHHRRTARETDAAEHLAHGTEPTFEPSLLPALASLSVRQRTSVLLVHGFGYTLEEAALLQGCRTSTVRNHLERGLRHLREHLGVTTDG
jgi:RNA polymerase sigma-70 factor (ECF subfamily)